MTDKTVSRVLTNRDKPRSIVPAHRCRGINILCKDVVSTQGISRIVTDFLQFFNGINFDGLRQGWDTKNTKQASGNERYYGYSSSLFFQHEHTLSHILDRDTALRIFEASGNATPISKYIKFHSSQFISFCRQKYSTKSTIGELLAANVSQKA